MGRTDLGKIEIRFTGRSGDITGRVLDIFYEQEMSDGEWRQQYYVEVTWLNTDGIPRMEPDFQESFYNTENDAWKLFDEKMYEMFEHVNTWSPDRGDICSYYIRFEFFDDVGDSHGRTVKISRDNGRFYVESLSLEPDGTEHFEPNLVEEKNSYSDALRMFDDEVLTIMDTVCAWAPTRGLISV